MQFTWFLLPPQLHCQFYPSFRWLHCSTLSPPLASLSILPFIPLAALFDAQFITSLSHVYVPLSSHRTEHKELTHIKETPVHFIQIYIFSCDTLTCGSSSLPYEFPCATTVRITDFDNRINYIRTRSNTTMLFIASKATSFGRYGHHPANAV